MQTLKLNIQDEVFDKIYYFLSRLPKNEVEIIKDSTDEDWSHLEAEIQKGINSGKSAKSHKEIIKSISANYANKL